METPNERRTTINAGKTRETLIWRVQLTGDLAEGGNALAKRIDYVGAADPADEYQRSSVVLRIYDPLVQFSGTGPTGSEADDGSKFWVVFKWDSERWEIIGGIADNLTQLFHNTSGFTAPTGAIMKVIDTVDEGAVADSDSRILQITRPNSTLGRQYVVNAGAPVPTGEYGVCSVGPLAEVLYDNTHTPVNGEGWGPKNGSWKIHKAYPETCIISGLINSTDAIVGCELHPIKSLVGAIDADLAKDTIGTISIWGGVPPEIDIGVNVEAFSELQYDLKYVAGTGNETWVELHWINNKWSVTKCQPLAMVVDFTLTEHMGATTANFAAASFAGSDGRWHQGKEPLATGWGVWDEEQLFRRARSGAKGKAVYDDIEHRLRVVECQTKAGWIVATLTADMASGASNGATVNSYGGTQQDIQDPGSTADLIDPVGSFAHLVTGDKVLAILDVGQNKYVVSSGKAKVVRGDNAVVTPAGTLIGNAGVWIEARTQTGGTVDLFHTGPHTPTVTPTEIGAASEGTEAAEGTTFAFAGTNSVALWVVSRVGYFHAGDSTLYGYSRKLTFDERGHLQAVSGETRFAIEAPEAC